MHLFAGLDHLKFAVMHAGAQQGYAYDLGNPKFPETIADPSIRGLNLCNTTTTGLRTRRMCSASRIMWEAII